MTQHLTSLTDAQEIVNLTEKLKAADAENAPLKSMDAVGVYNKSLLAVCHQVIS
jgi:hypothetical protein